MYEIILFLLLSKVLFMRLFSFMADKISRYIKGWYSKYCEISQNLVSHFEWRHSVNKDDARFNAKAMQP